MLYYIKPGKLNVAGVNIPTSEAAAVANLPIVINGTPATSIVLNGEQIVVAYDPTPTPTPTPTTKDFVIDLPIDEETGEPIPTQITSSMFNNIIAHSVDGVSKFVVTYTTSNITHTETIDTAGIYNITKILETKDVWEGGEEATDDEYVEFYVKYIDTGYDEKIGSILTYSSGVTIRCSYIKIEAVAIWK